MPDMGISQQPGPLDALPIQKAQGNGVRQALDLVLDRAYLIDTAGSLGLTQKKALYLSYFGSRAVSNPASLALCKALPGCSLP